MLDAEEAARGTAEIGRSTPAFGPDRVVFLSEPGGTVFWLDSELLDPPVLPHRMEFARLACFLELEVAEAERQRR